MRNIITLTELDVLVDERVNGITPEQKIIQISDVHRGVSKLAFVQALCRQITDAGAIQTFEAVAECFKAAHEEITKDKTVEELFNEAWSTQENLEGKVIEMQGRLGA